MTGDVAELAALLGELRMTPEHVRGGGPPDGAENWPQWDAAWLVARGVTLREPTYSDILREFGACGEPSYHPQLYCALPKGHEGDHRCVTVTVSAQWKQAAPPSGKPSVTDSSQRAESPS